MLSSINPKESWSTKDVWEQFDWSVFTLISCFAQSGLEDSLNLSELICGLPWIGICNMRLTSWKHESIIKNLAESLQKFLYTEHIFI